VLVGESKRHATGTRSHGIKLQSYYTVMSNLV